MRINHNLGAKGDYHSPSLARKTCVNANDLYESRIGTKRQNERRMNSLGWSKETSSKLEREQGSLPANAARVCRSVDELATNVAGVNGLRLGYVFRFLRRSRVHPGNTVN